MPFQIAQVEIVRRCVTALERVRWARSSGAERAYVCVEGREGGSLGRDQPRGEREGSHGWAPTALAGLQGSCRAVVVKPRLDVPPAPRRQRSDGREGVERRDQSAPVPARSRAGVAASEVVHHRAAEGRGAIVQGRHAHDVWDSCPREPGGRGQCDASCPAAGAGLRTTRRPAKEAEPETSARAGRDHPVDSHRRRCRCPRHGAPGSAGDPP
jgi:hypothetical protein